MAERAHETEARLRANVAQHGSIFESRYRAALKGSTCVVCQRVGTAPSWWKCPAGWEYGGCGSLYCGDCHSRIADKLCRYCGNETRSLDGEWSY